MFGHALLFKAVGFICTLILLSFGFEFGKEFFFAEALFASFGRAVICSGVLPLVGRLWAIFAICRVVFAFILVMPPLVTVVALAFVICFARRLSLGIETSLLILVFAIVLGIILSLSCGNRADESVLLVLLSKEKLLLTEFIISIEIIASSEVKIVQLGFELLKACSTPYNLDFENMDPTSVAPDDIAEGTSNG